MLVRRRDGQFAVLEPPEGGRISSDATMTACLGGVDLTDGLEHFVDVDAPAGTVEERALVKAFDEGDPSVIKVFLVNGFTGGGRIGESFIYADRSSVRNVVLIDRAGVRADRSSFALAHELGHILLDMPGHPDDYGTDVPTLLIDSDATDPSSFGPRRLTLADCARAHRESGPLSPALLLAPFQATTGSAGPISSGKHWSRPAGCSIWFVRVVSAPEVPWVGPRSGLAPAGRGKAPAEIRDSARRTAAPRGARSTRNRPPISRVDGTSSLR